MDWGSFMGGMGGGLQSSGLLKNMMMKKLQPPPQQPQMTPGFEDPNAMMSQAPMPMSVPGQPDQFQQGDSKFGGLKDLMTRLFGGI